MASIQQVFMNAIYYELSAISEYDALVDYVSQHYQDDNMVEPFLLNRNTIISEHTITSLNEAMIS